MRAMQGPVKMDHAWAMPLFMSAQAGFSRLCLNFFSISACKESSLQMKHAKKLLYLFFGYEGHNH